MSQYNRLLESPSPPGLFDRCLRYYADFALAKEVLRVSGREVAAEWMQCTDKLWYRKGLQCRILLPPGGSSNGTRARSGSSNGTRAILPLSASLPARGASGSQAPSRRMAAARSTSTSFASSTLRGSSLASEILELEYEKSSRV